MIRKSRLALLVVAVSFPVFAACSESTTGPELKVRKDATYDSLVALGCGDLLPWGKAPCANF